jgi:segregation and condensation protein A
MESTPTPLSIAPDSFFLRNLDDFMIDIESKITDMYATILTLAEKSEVVRFSALVQGIKRRGAIRTFILILFLANRGRIQLWQDEEFGEMYIRLSKERVLSYESNT